MIQFGAVAGRERQSPLTHTKRIDDQGDMDKATEHDIEFVKT